MPDKFDLQPLDDFDLQPLEEEEPWYKKIATPANAARFIGSSLGDLGLAVPIVGPALPFIGGAAGEGVGRWLEDKPFDPSIMALEGGLNYWPGAGKLERTTYGAIGDYARRSAIHGGVQGAVGTYPRHQAEAGNLWEPEKWENPSLNEYAAQTALGAGIGAAVGTGVGAHARYKNPPRPTRTTYSTSRPQGPDYSIVEEPPALPPPRTGGNDIVEGEVVGGPPPSSGPSAPPSDGFPPIVTIEFPDMPTVKMWRDRGYVHVPGSRPLQMARPEFVNQAQTSPEPQPPNAPINRPEMPGPIPQGHFEAGDVVPIPNEKAENPTFLAGMLENYTIAEKGPTHTLFKRLIKEDEGGVSHEEIWKNLRRMLGRDPNIDELDAAMRRQKDDAERGGLVANFPNPNDISANRTPSQIERFWAPDPNDPNNNLPPVDMEALQKFKDENAWLGGRPEPTEPQLGDPLPDFPRDEFGNRIMGTPPRTPEEVRAWYDKQAEIQGPRTFDTMDEMPGPNDPMWSENKPAPVQQGQLFPMEMRARNQLRNITEQGMTQEPPVQPSMVDQMVDNEIKDRLSAQDAIPPEMKDLSTYGPERMEKPSSHPQEESSRRIVDIFRRGLPEATADNRRDTRFILPDGTRLTHLRDIHEQAVHDLGFQISEAQKAGIIRTDVGFNGAEIHTPITREQAEQLADAVHYTGKNMGIDVWAPKGKERINGIPIYHEMVSKTFDENVTASTIRNWVNNQFRAADEPSRMEVPNTRRGGGYSNIAVGGADEPVLDMLATALYTRDRPATVVKELLQNSGDERKISGINEPIRVVFHSSAKHPITGDDALSLIVKDFGRGMPPEQLYTIFTDVGKSGKRDIATASGGFGFAKAAPLLGGDYVKVESIVRDESGDLIRYTFEGNPAQLKNQKQGVPLTDELVEDPNAKTGFKVEVFFPSDKTLGAAETLLKQTVENSPGMTGVESYSTYTSLQDYIDEFLTTGTTRSTYENNKIKQYVGKPVPPMQGQLKTPGADIDIHYELDNIERKGAEIAYLNNGMFALQDNIAYGYHPMPHVPGKIVANVKATVPEGTEGYPFGLNREEMNREVLAAVKTWVRDNITKNAEAMRIAELQQAFDALQPAPGNQHVIMDSGNRYTPIERQNLEQNQNLRWVADNMQTMLDELDGLFPVGTPGGQIGRTAKFGWQIHDPGKGGMNIPSPSSPINAKEFAILINPLGLMSSTDNPALAAEKMAHAILHEFNHNIARNEGAGFTWSLLQADAKYGTQRRSQIVDAIRNAISGPDGKYAPGIQKLLQEYTAARGRPDTTVDTLSRQRESEYLEAGEGQSGVSGGDRDAGGGTFRAAVDYAKNLLKRFTTEEQGATPFEDIKAAGRKIKTATGWGQGATKGGTQSPQEFNWIKEAMSVPRNATTTLDLSYPGRQGLAQLATPEFWVGLYKMGRGITPEGMNQINRELMKNEIMRRPIDPETGKEGPSFAEKHMGIHLNLPASHPGATTTKRMEATASKWLETGGTVPYLSAIYRHSAGYGVRATNRMFLTMHNYLKINRAQKLVDTMRNMSIRGIDTGETAMPGLLGGIQFRSGENLGFSQKVSQQEAMDLNPYHNLVLAKELGDFVNTATGQAPLKTHGLPLKQAEVNAEKIGNFLRHTMFSPGLFFSRVRLLNPSTYAMASPYVRKQYLHALLSVGAGWFMAAELIKNGLGDDAEVGNVPTSADFGKVRIGDTRFDTGGGFLQFLTAYARLYEGGSTSSRTGEFHRFGSGYQATTQEDMMERFMVNKLDPIYKFIYDMYSASEYNPFHVGDRMLQLITPLMAQDLVGIASENPDLLPWMAPVSLGVGTQTYGQGESVGKLIDPENDWLTTGGGIKDLMPWNWQAAEGEKRTFPWSEPE